MRLTFWQPPSASKPVPGAELPMMVPSNSLPSDFGRRFRHSLYRALLSRTNSSENGSMTAILYGRMTFLPKVWVETGLDAVSATQFATGSPVMVWMSMPEPGISMRRASCMNALCSMVFAQISRETSAGSSTLVVPRLMSIAVIASFFRLCYSPSNASANIWAVVTAPRSVC